METGRVIGFCGLVCSECEAYTATQSRDLEALERIAAVAREQYGAPDATAENVRCDGCPGETEHKVAYCATCDVRSCAVERGVTTCADCEEYGCERVSRFWANAPGAKETLEALRGFGA